MSCALTEHSALEATKCLLHMRVRVPGHRSSISPLVRRVMQVIRDTACATGRGFAIEIALREALANAAVHGCENDPSRVVECSISCDASGELNIVVRDPGRGFDPDSVVKSLFVCESDLTAH